MSDSDFWSDLEKKFRALAERNPGKLKMGWSRIVGIEVTNDVCLPLSLEPDEWVPLGVDVNSKSTEIQDNMLAIRAGGKLAVPGASGERSLRELWLNTLRSEGFGDELGASLEPVRVSSKLGCAPRLIIHRKCGKIENLICAEADFCSILGQRALETEHQMNGLAEGVERSALAQFIAGAPGNIELLLNVHGDLERSVTYATARRYLGCGTRQIQKLVKSGHLKTIGGGLNKRITVTSLLEYRPANNAPKEKTN
jgi:hypothetical protein